MKELEKLVYCYRIPKTNMGNQESRRQKWREIKAQNKAPPQYKKWIDEDKARLLRLSQTKNIPLEDTVLGRLKAQRTAEFEATFETMPRQKRQEYLDKLLKVHEAGVGGLTTLEPHTTQESQNVTDLTMTSSI